MIDLESCAKTVCQIARRAGAYVREERGKFSVERVERKHAHDYVSYVDKGSERLIVSALRELLPEAGGTVTDYSGSSDYTRGNSVVATNGLVHHDLLAAIAGAS